MSKPAAEEAPLLRRAQPTDLDQLCQLWESASGYYASLDPCFALRAGEEGELRSMLRRLLGDPRRAVWVVPEYDPLQGYLLAQVLYGPPLAHESVRGEICDLFVVPEARRKGLGRALVGEALAWLRQQGTSRVELRVARGNKAGQAFWRQLGFSDHISILHSRF